MTRTNNHRTSSVIKRFCKGCKRCLYRFLVAVYEGDIRFSMFGIVCMLLGLILLFGCFLPHGKKQLLSTPVTSLGNSLTFSLKNNGSNHPCTDADVTLFLLPETGEQGDLTNLLSAPLYGFYLSGKEIAYLPEYVTSLTNAFPDTAPYIGGLSFSYNPKRITYNRTTELFLLSQDGQKTALEPDNLYYVVGTESVFGMFSYLSDQTYHLINLRPKDASGVLIADYSRHILRGPQGSYCLGDFYKSNSLATGLGIPNNSITGEVYLCNTLNTVDLLAQPNIAGYFILGNLFLLFTMALAIQPYLRRIRIWFRIYLIRRKKRGKLSLRGHLTFAPFFRLTHRTTA